MSNMIGCLRVVRIYSFMKEIKLYIRASYIVFLFVKSKTNFKKTCSPCPHSLVKTKVNVWENSSADQLKKRDAVESFYLIEDAEN